MNANTRTVTVSPSSPSQPTRRMRVPNLLRRPVAVVSLAWIVAVVVACTCAPLFTSHDPLAQNLTAIKELPSVGHWLGTDELGRDVFSRILYGGRPTILGVVEAVMVAGVLGVGLGLVAGYAGGFIDRAVGQVTDLIMAMPTIVILLCVLAVFPGNLLAAMVTLGILGSAGVTRVVRSATLAVRSELYVSAARLSGLTHLRILVRHIVPRVAGPIIVQLSLFGAIAVVMQTGLAYLGLGIQPPAPSWGNMIGEASNLMESSPWLLFPPGLAVAFTVLSFGLLGDEVRDVAAERWTGAPTAKPKRRSRTLNASTAEVAEIPAAGAALSVRGLTIVHESPWGDSPLVDDVSFDVAPGETLGLVGESGCGKTLTSLAVIGMLPPGLRVVRGSAWIHGEELPLDDSEAMAAWRGSQIAMISQEPMVSLDPCFKVGHQLAEVVRTHTSCSRREARTRAVELLKQVRIPDPEKVAQKYVHEISGGMAQRVCIARALAGEPRVLLADEPTTALDVTVQAEILDLLDLLQTEAGMAMLLVTHDWGVVADACDRAVVLYAGEIVESGEVAALVEKPRHPYTADLLLANPILAVPGQPLPTISGSVSPDRSQDRCRFADRCTLAIDACVEAKPALEEYAEERQVRCIRPDDVREVPTLSLQGVRHGK